MLICTQLNVQALFPQCTARTNMFQVRNDVAENNITILRQTQTFYQGFLGQPAGALVQKSRRDPDPTARIGEPILIDDQSAFGARAI